MKERPILFSAPMVRAILAGTKTQTRRVVKPQPIMRDGEPVWPNDVARPRGRGFEDCPYGNPGDRLWVRETFMHEPADYCWEASVSIPCRPACTIYRADHEGDSRGAGWIPSIHMPRSLSRITLEIKDVRVERLNDISDDDCVAEGCDDTRDLKIAPGRIFFADGPKGAYRALWESINGPGSWDANPWVWVIQFEVAR